MSEKLLRIAFAIEFLVALVAVFTAWSEIGGQAALDLMQWGWKLGFSLLLSAAIVGYTATIVHSDSLWTIRSIQWITAMILSIVAMGVITYFYALQVDSGESDETGTVSFLVSKSFVPLA